MRGQHHRLAALLTLFGLSALLSFANSAKNHFMTAASSAPPSVSTGQGDDMRRRREALSCELWTVPHGAA